MNNSSNHSYNRNALPIGHHLDNYLIQAILGDGGFGITYLAKDTHLDALVAIKEYLPNELAVRQGDNYTVLPKSQSDADNFAWGLDRFVKEARTLAQFKHPNIVRVLHFFQANNTAYIVMEYEQGQNLVNLLKQNNRLTEEELMRFLPAVLDGLETVHNAGYLHRDIKPSNIYLREKDNSPVLIDFGSARYDLGSRSRSLTMIVTPGYAPFEQYQSDGTQQGAWTDIYATGAVLYRFVSGKILPEATERVSAMMRGKPDPLVAAVKVAAGQYSQQLLEAIDWALAINEQERPQNIRAWRGMLFLEQRQESLIGLSAEIDELPTSPIEPPIFPNDLPTRLLPSSSRLTPRRGNWTIAVVVVLLLAVLIGGGWLFHQMNRLKEENERLRDKVVHTGFEEGASLSEAQPVIQPPFSSEPETPYIESEELEAARLQREHEARLRMEAERAAEKARQESARRERERREAMSPSARDEASLRAEAVERADAAQALLPNGPLRIMTGAGVLLRQEPRRSAKKGGILQIGTIIRELEIFRLGEEEWYRIETPNQEIGWVYGGYTMSLNPDKRAEAYIEVAENKLNSNRASLGDLVDLYNFLSRAYNEVDLNSSVELQLLRLLTLQQSLKHIQSDEPTEPSHSLWISQHWAKIVYNESSSRWLVKREVFQQLYDKYSFLPIAARIMRQAPR